MLRHRRDLQSLFYLAVHPLLALYLWQCFDAGLKLYWLSGYALLIFLEIALSAVHHNHAHYRLWQNKYANRLTDHYISLLQGHPTFVFYASHNANHHRYHHGPKDLTRTYRFGGDSNHLTGFLIHPLQATWVLYPVFWQWLKRLWRRQRRVCLYYLSQYLWVLALWSGTLWLDSSKALLIIIVPQLIGLHWLLATNYLQHAHADGASPLNFARNFSGLVNLLCFNIGYHTAHHLHPRVHWTELPRLHQQLLPQLAPQLQERGLAQYLLRRLLLASFLPSWRTRSLLGRSEPAQAATFNSDSTQESEPYAQRF